MADLSRMDTIAEDHDVYMGGNWLKILESSFTVHVRVPMLETCLKRSHAPGHVSGLIFWQRPGPRLRRYEL